MKKCGVCGFKIGWVRGSLSGRGITGRLTMDQKSRPTKMSLFHKNESPDTCYLTTPVFPAKTDFCFDFCIFTTPLAHHTRSILLDATPILLALNIRYCLTATPYCGMYPADDSGQMKQMATILFSKLVLFTVHLT